MGRTGKKIPDRWMDYDAFCNAKVEGTRFICFKTPLSERLCRRIHKNYWFTVPQLLMKVAMLPGRLGLVIDLTATDRYYDPEDFRALDIEHRKIYCPGHEVDAREDLVQDFMEAVDNFIIQNPGQNSGDEDLLIGVHCTHGINRTGYLICRYLMERKGKTYQEAIDAFAQARGYPIERDNYIHKLSMVQQAKESGGSIASNSYVGCGRIPDYEALFNADWTRELEHFEQLVSPALVES